MVSGVISHPQHSSAADAAGHSSATAHIHPSFTASQRLLLLLLGALLGYVCNAHTRVFCFGARGGKHQK
jgi:hypothetical protein